MIKTIICGNLTVDPVIYEREYTNKETGEILKAKVCNFTVAAEDGYGPAKKTSFFRIAAWRSLGEMCEKYLRKGRQVLIQGPVSLNNYVDSNNNLRATLEIRAEDIQFLQDGRKVVTEEEPLY